MKNCTIFQVELEFWAGLKWMTSRRKWYKIPPMSFTL